jgi:carbamoyltransferase
LQIARQETDPFTYAYLKAMGRRNGEEVSVNTSLNVGSPIVQTPGQALGTLKRAKGMDGLLLLGDQGEAYLAWHDIEGGLKDGGRALRTGVESWKPAPK